jgi:hypothetical protein
MRGQGDRKRRRQEIGSTNSCPAGTSKDTCKEGRVGGAKRNPPEGLQVSPHHLSASPPPPPRHYCGVKCIKQSIKGGESFS